MNQNQKEARLAARKAKEECEDLTQQVADILLEHDYEASYIRNDIPIDKLKQILAIVKELPPC